MINVIKRVFRLFFRGQKGTDEYRGTVPLVPLLLVVVMLAGCSDKEPVGQESREPEKEHIVIGFSQLGAESDWRSANSESMRSAFSKENGYELIFEDGQQKQANQIMAIRTFIQQEVDYIVLAPVTETGWDTVLQEAKEANIPVIIVDRMVQVEDDSLFTCWVGSDFELEGKKVAEWLNRFTQKQGIAPEDVHIVNIQGTMGGSAQIGRTNGLREAAGNNGWDLMAEMSGEFTQTKGKEVMQLFLKQYPELNVVYCENDNEALGAIEAIEASGKTVGPNIMDGEIMVLSFDGVRQEAMQYVTQGKIQCIGECNPLHGPRVRAIIEQLEDGRQPEKLSYVDEGMYVHDRGVDSVIVNKVVYPVTVVTEELLKEREY